MRSKVGQKDLPGYLKVLLLLAICILYALVLFSMDEGRNSLKGIFETGNLAGLGFYYFSMIGFTIAIYQLLKIFIKNIPAGIISLLIGPVAGISVMWGLFMLISRIF